MRIEHLPFSELKAVETLKLSECEGKGRLRNCLGVRAHHTSAVSSRRRPESALCFTSTSTMKGDQEDDRLRDIHGELINSPGKDNGKWSDSDLLKETARVVREVFMYVEPDRIDFSLMALAKTG